MRYLWVGFGLSLLLLVVSVSMQTGMAQDLGSGDEYGLIEGDGAGAGGDVVGPGSSIDESICRFDGLTGKIIQGSGWTITDTNVLIGAGDYDQSGGNINDDSGDGIVDIAGDMNVTGEYAFNDSGEFNGNTLNDIGQINYTLGGSTDGPLYQQIEKAAETAPAAGFGRWWIRNDAPNTPMFTDDTDVDHVLNTGGDVTGPASNTDNHIPLFSGTTGKVLDDTSTIAVTAGPTLTPTTGSMTIAADLTISGNPTTIGSDAHIGGQVVLDAGTIAADDVTPSIVSDSIFVTSANTISTGITTFDDATIDQIFWVCGGSNTNSTTIADGGNFALEAEITLSLDVCIFLWAQGTSDFIEISRNVAVPFELNFLMGFGPNDGIFPSTAPAGAVTRNGRALVAFDSTTDENLIFEAAWLTDDYDPANNLRVEVDSICDGITSGAVRWCLEVESTATQDFDTDGFASAVCANSTCSATDGVASTAIITFTSGAWDGGGRNIPYRLRLSRDADNAADTAAGDAQFFHIAVRQQ
ncbi:hypothetical protein LCGC14_0424640 [marine sediment metagenome]|uniref:Uncharacterized protein n=1 Tax=marine sediment metagenome TaxID=412755 RepID=A0A0F9T7V0_9ZZZZ